MAWRDSRGKRLLLLLFTSSVVFGIGAIVAIHSLRENLQRIVDEQAKTLLGADVIFQTRQTPTPELESFIRSLPGEKTAELRFRSMAVFPEAEASRLVQVRAIDGPVPFYGRMETQPQLDADQVLPEPGEAIVEESLIYQFGLKPGDLLRLGEKDYTIVASLVRIDGESGVTGFFAPRIYVNKTDIEETGLIQKGSILRHRTHFKVDDDRPLLSAINAQRDTLLLDNSVRVVTVEDRRESIQSVLNNLLDFLNLIGFIALLLGGIGIIGAVNIYLQGKRETIAVLRCLGASSGKAFSIYLVQLLGSGFLGAVAGTLLGIGVQFVVPLALQSFLPFPIQMRVSTAAVLTGLFFGWTVVSASAVIPLLGIRRISPLRAIRASVESTSTGARDPLTWFAGLLLGVIFLGFTLIQSRRVEIALYFLAGLVVALAVLGSFAWLLREGLRRLRAPGLPYAYRLALSNLYRPNNRTLILIITLGMGVLLVNTLSIVREGLLEQVDVQSSEDAANVILFDIQPDQREPVVQLLEEMGHPAEEVIPVVTMRVQAIDGKSLREWKQMEESPVSDWVYTWEFRNTYRDHVLDNAEVIEGQFIRSHGDGEPYPVSLSENVIEDFGIGTGDSITWNVQGVEVRSYVSSIRRVKWQAGRQNFNVVFPLGTIEAAPTVYAVSIRTDSRVATADVQKSLSERFPNVSVIDLSLVFDSIDDILGKASFVINFMAGFTIVTGLIVLAGAVMGSRYQRLRESVLFRTLGASSRLIRTTLSIEFLLLGLVSDLAGLLLSWICGWALLHLVFEAPLVVQPFGSLLLLAGVMLLTLLTGWSTSRGIATQPPLVILRKE